MIKNKIVKYFPFVRKIRQMQRKIYFFTKLSLKKIFKKYSIKKQERQLQFKAYECNADLLNYDSDINLKSHHNKIENLKIASEYINKIIIKPGETFSFWNIIGSITARKGYKDSICHIRGEIVSDIGGGICKLSSLIFYCALHTGLKIVERHSHNIQEKNVNLLSKIPLGMDAAVSEGWFDLVIKNQTDTTYQIIIYIDDSIIKCKILSDKKEKFKYEVYEKNNKYFKSSNKLYYYNEIYRKILDKKSNLLLEDEFLFNNTYKLVNNICTIDNSSKQLHINI